MGVFVGVSVGVCVGVAVGVAVIVEVNVTVKVPVGDPVAVGSLSRQPVTLTLSSNGPPGESGARLWKVRLV
jgi:hypothetical protein